MATINLTCSSGHDFEAWFRSLDDFEKQREGLLVACPWCGDHNIERRLSVPNVISPSRRKKSRTLTALEAMASGGRDVAANNAHRDNVAEDNMTGDNMTGDERDSVLAAAAPMLAFAKQLRHLHEYVEAHCDDVGEKFAEEARRRHEEKFDKNFWGEAENRNGKQRSNRGIRGKASIDEVRSLHEEGIEIAALPPLPSSYN